MERRVNHPLQEDHYIQMIGGTWDRMTFRHEGLGPAN